MKKKLSLALVVLLVFSLIAACAPAATPDPPPPTDPPTQQTEPTEPTELIIATMPEDGRYGGILRQVTTVEGAGPIGLPWTRAPQDDPLTGAIMEAFTREHEDGSVSAALAHSWDVDPDDRRITFFLQEGVRFHDGSPWNAHVAAWNIETRLASPRSFSNPPYNVEVLDNYTITFQLPDGITNSTLGLFSQPAWRMVSMESYLANGTEWAEQNPIGTGPFRFVDYTLGLQLTLERNDDYWMPELPFLDGVEYHFIRDVMTQQLALRAPHGEGAVDALRTHSAEISSTFRDLGYRLVPNHILTLGLFPSSNPDSNPDSPWTNLYVRRALSAAIDRAAITNSVGFGIWEPAYQWIVPARAAWVPDPGYGVPGFDPDYARELLERGGFPDGFDTTIIVQPGATTNDAIVAIQYMLSNVGINAEIQFPDGGGFTTIRNGGWEGIIVHNIMNFIHMEGMFTSMFSRNTNWFYSMRNSDEWHEMGEETAFLGDNTEEVRRAQHYSLDEAIIIPVWYTNSSIIVRGGLMGWYGSTQQNWYRYMYWED